MPLAARRGASKITRGPRGTWPLDYQELVQPVLDAACVECHRPGGEGGSIVLTADRSYETLVNFGAPSLQEHVLQRYQEGQSQAGACAAASNPLWKLLEAGHYGVMLDRQESARLISWMDTYGQRSGSFDADQAAELVRLREHSAEILSD